METYKELPYHHQGERADELRDLALPVVHGADPERACARVLPSGHFGSELVWEKTTTHKTPTEFLPDQKRNFFNYPSTPLQRDCPGPITRN